MGEGAARGFRLTQGDAPDRYDRYVAPVMGPFVEALLDVAGLRPGLALIDVACGTGFVARGAAVRMAGWGSRVVGVDLVPGMLRTAAARAADDGVVVEWQEAEAGDLPYAGGAFDVALCQQGVQFFPDRGAAVAEFVRVLRPGGRVAVTAWVEAARSPFFAAQQQAYEEVGGVELGEWCGSAFGCSADELTGLFGAYGLRDVAAREVVAEVRLPALTAYVPGCLAATPWGQALAETRPDALARAGELVRGLLAPYATADGSVTLPFVSSLVTGVRADTAAARD
ncbi:class I SAM-dependent methyltransferase [Streptomyces sp. NPDC047315]|uniref:class I SAM-dependent methyltransferase n=1 Tax=Streptomyces sp. NPDC047315 TaxID=3155142 RepID=UPI0033D7970B